MEIKTVGQFVSLVSAMRKAQKKALRTHISVDEAAARGLEVKVDKALVDREKNRVKKEKASQGELF